MDWTSGNWTETEFFDNYSVSDEQFYNFVAASNYVCYSLFFLGGFLNIFVIYVMVRSGQLRKNISSFLIFHLSVTHLLFQFSFALTTSGGPLSRGSVVFFCKMSSFTEHAYPAAIFSTLVAIAWDRHKNILQPFKSLAATKSWKSYLLLVAVIWTYAVISSVSFVHSVTVRTVRSEKDCCMVNNTQQKCEEYMLCHTPLSWKTQISETVYFLMAFFIPLSYMLVAYTRIAVRLWKRSKHGMIHSAAAKHKTKSIRLLLVAVLGFVFCWGPGIFLNLLAKYRVLEGQSSENDCILKIWSLLAQVSSSCINTAVYAFFSPEFRKNCIKFGCCCFRPFIQCCCRCGDHRVSPVEVLQRRNACNKRKLKWSNNDNLRSRFKA